MIFDFICKKCRRVFEKNVPAKQKSISCPYCKRKAKKMFQATTNFYIPSYFHTSRSDIFDEGEWQDLKKNPDIERAK